jgi:hypothetical protein
VLTGAAMLGAFLYFQTLQTCSVTVATAWTAGPAVVEQQLDPAQRARRFNDRRDRSFSLTPECFIHCRFRKALIDRTQVTDLLTELRPVDNEFCNAVLDLRHEIICASELAHLGSVHRNDVDVAAKGVLDYLLSRASIAS